MTGSLAASVASSDSVVHVLSFDGSQTRSMVTDGGGGGSVSPTERVKRVPIVGWAGIAIAGDEEDREDRGERGIEAVHFALPAGLSVAGGLMLVGGFGDPAATGFAGARFFASALPAKRSMMNPTRSFASVAASPSPASTVMVRF